MLLTGFPGVGAPQVDVPHPEASPLCKPVADLQAVLGLPQDPDSHSWVAVNATVLIGWLIFYRVLVYVALRYKTTSR